MCQGDRIVDPNRDVPILEAGRVPKAAGHVDFIQEGFQADTGVRCLPLPPPGKGQHFHGPSVLADPGHRVGACLVHADWLEGAGRAIHGAYLPTRAGW